jgi:hypothetical protein
MPDHDRTRVDGAAELTRKVEARQVARVEAMHVVERWNRALAAGRGALWSPTIRAAVIADQSLLSLLHRAADVPAFTVSFGG